MSTAGGSRPCSPGWTRCCPAAIVDDPALVLLSAWIALAAEDPAELNRWLAVAEQLRWTGPLPRWHAVAGGRDRLCHARAIYRKLGVDSRKDAVAAGRKLGLVR
jgi:ATP/maltotriose-dependent transcriptional regulator MalT